MISCNDFLVKNYSFISIHMIHISLNDKKNVFHSEIFETDRQKSNESFSH